MASETRLHAVTEQVDAMRAMGRSSRKLVTPRVLAMY